MNKILSLAIPASLLHRIDKNKIHLNEKVISIDLVNKTATTTKGTYQFDNLISTIPFPFLLKLVGFSFDESIYSWNKVLVYNLGFDSKGLDSKNNWVYFSGEDLSFYRVGYYDNIFNTEKMSLYVELGFDKDREIDTDRIFDQVLSDLAKAKILTTQKLISKHQVIMNPAYVHITKQSNEDVQQKKKS